MIKHLHNERQQLIGTPPASGTSQAEATLPARSHDEPSAADRRIQPGRFLGDHNSFQVLPSLGLSFAALRQAYEVSGRAALDVGASMSTLALEGALRGIPIYSTDLLADKNRLNILSFIERRLHNLKNIYVPKPHELTTNEERLPAGFECPPFTEFQWRDVVAHCVNQVNQTLSQCDASCIRLPDGRPAPDRMFSVVMSSHGVPKYCIDQNFLQTELRELLRVTDGRLVLFPFISAGPDHELLHIPNSPSRQIIERTARELGFTFETKVYRPIIEPEGGAPTNPGYNITAVFARLGTRYPLPL